MLTSVSNDPVGCYGVRVDYQPGGFRAEKDIRMITQRVIRRNTLNTSLIDRRRYGGFGNALFPRNPDTIGSESLPVIKD